MAFQESVSGPRRLDAFQLAKVQPGSLERYRRALVPFLHWLLECGYAPQGAEQWDDLLVEWRNACMPSKSSFEACVAATEFVFARFRGRLSWSHSVISGWAIAHITRHTVPMGLGPACLKAAHLAAAGHGRLGLAVVIQRLFGLRPSEILGVQCRDVSLPEHATSVVQAPVCTIGLGVRSGTKAKRAQAVMLRDLVGIGMVRYLCSTLTSEEPIIGYTYEQYRRLLSKVEKEMGLEIGWTPHSPRSGFASELTSAGVPFTEIRELGRWIADSSLRTYIDVVSSASISVSLRLTGLSSALLFAQTKFLHFYPGSRPFCYEALSHGLEGFHEGTGRGPSSALGPFLGTSAGGLPIDIATEEDQIEGGKSGSDIEGQSKCNQNAGGKRFGGRGQSSSSRGRGRTHAATQSVSHSASSSPSLASGRGRGRGRRSS